ncbi:MAG: LacI family DNA-binding transcriptional regulator [Clostridia bacterium]|nr:LacI family DNA-binding transcriptional regulator [Clostridia bacterium]
MTISIKEIAELAGVSISTVSRALNNYQDISKKTRSEIIKIAKKHNYKPNAFARSLVTKDSRTIGLFLDEYKGESLNQSYYYRIICGINDVLNQQGYDVTLISNSLIDKKNKSWYLDITREKHLTATIFLGTDIDEEMFKYIEQYQVKCVVIDHVAQGETIACVNADNVKGAFWAVEHLIKNQHENIAFISGDLCDVSNRDKQDGYFLALNRYGIKLDKNMIFCGESTLDGGYQATHKLIEYNKDISAIFAANDMMAIGAIKFAKEVGYRVPQDISIIGYQNTDISRYIQPSLTTVDIDWYKIGRTAATVLVNLIKGENLEKVMVDPKLIIRESTCEKK